MPEAMKAARMSLGPSAEVIAGPVTAHHRAQVGVPGRDSGVSQAAVSVSMVATNMSQHVPMPRGRVAAAHCCAAAPSEPDVHDFHASGSSKPKGPLACSCAGCRSAGLPAVAVGVEQTESRIVRAVLF